MDEKNLERSLRRKLEKLELSLCKSRVKNTHHDNQGGYMIFNPYRNGVVEGMHYELTLEDVKNFVEEYRRERENKA